VVTQRQLGAEFERDKTTISRWVRAALEAGYLVNREERRNQAHKLVPGDPPPDDREILPELHGCTVDGGDGTPPTPKAPQADSPSEIARADDPELAARADAVQERLEGEGWDFRPGPGA
jgi:hypothetical protein